MKQYIAVFLLLITCSACNSASDNLITDNSGTLIKSGFDEEAMEAAILTARNKVNRFLTELSNPTGEGHAVKVPIDDKNGTEHFWLIDVVYRNGQFEGIINNDPGIVENVQIGQQWTVKKADISDWMFMRDGKMYGNYTLQPLLKTMPDEQAEELRAILAEP